MRIVRPCPYQRCLVPAAVIMLGFFPSRYGCRGQIQRPKRLGPPGCRLSPTRNLCPKLLCVVKTAHGTVFARSSQSHLRHRYWPHSQGANLAWWWPHRAVEVRSGSSASAELSRHVGFTPDFGRMERRRELTLRARSRRQGVHVRIESSFVRRWILAISSVPDP
jgi:hypothetical protein